jgi:hypothetical protein
VRNIDDTDDEWVVIIDIRNKMIKKLLGKSQNEDNEIEKILNELETILRNEESIREIDTNYKL